MLGFLTDKKPEHVERLLELGSTGLGKYLIKKRINGYTEDDLIDLKRQESLFKKLSPETMVIPAPKSIEEANRIIKLPVYDDVNYLKNMSNKTVELMASRCGILCLSTRCDSLPMWAHYAHNHQGVVIEVV